MLRSYDSYPYVCVIMLSDTDGMLGGETYIKTGDGVPMKVRTSAFVSTTLLICVAGRRTKPWLRRDSARWRSRTPRRSMHGREGADIYHHILLRRCPRCLHQRIQDTEGNPWTGGIGSDKVI